MRRGETAMFVSDAQGNPLTASSSDAAACLDRTVTAFLGMRQDTGDHLKRTLAEDPDFVLAHCLRGCFMMLFGQRALVPRAARALAAARDAAQRTGATPREHAHLAALAVWVAGDFVGATAHWEAITAEYPRDAMALKLAQYGCFYAGESAGMHDVAARALRAWRADMPGYGFILGCLAFGLEETGDYRAAEQAGRDAIAINSADIWAAHAVAHVFEMTDRPRDGIEWIDGLAGQWSACNNFAYHLFWHRCLFWLECAPDRVLDLYDREVRPASTDDLLDIANAASLLWRVEQEGIGVGDRWQELAACAQAHIDDHLLMFGDLHYLLALASADRTDDAARLVEDLGRFARDSGESQAAIARQPGLALAQALLAHRRGDHDHALRELLSARDIVWRIGGSHAQRDLFEQLLIVSAISAERLDLAARFVAQRVERRPGNGWARRWQAKIPNPKEDAA